jgi:hypothetical protein
MIQTLVPQNLPAWRVPLKYLEGPPTLIKIQHYSIHKG